MRRSERDARLVALARRLFGDAHRILTVDIALARDAPPLPARHERVSMTARELSGHDETADASRARFDAALVRLTAPLGLSAQRGGARSQDGTGAEREEPLAASVRAQIAAVRARLADGARMLLVTSERPGMSERARALLTRTPPTCIPLALVCDALLTFGLAAVTRHDDVPGSLLVSAEVPTRTALDAFFTQLCDAARR